MQKKALSPVFLLPFIVLVLLSGLYAGLLRLGWGLPVLQLSLSSLHGPLMVSGFLGPLIAVERVVALGRRWALIVPGLSVLGGLFLLTGVALRVGIGLLTLGSLGMVLISAEIIRRDNSLHTWTMALGALAWLGGNLLWFFGASIWSVSYWWGGFLLLVIAGERLELSRVRRPPVWARRAFGVIVFSYVTGLLLSITNFTRGMRLASAAVLLLALWLLSFDVVRRNIRQQGLTRYIAANLLIGYLWLIVSGLLGMFYSPLRAGLHYDAWLHTLFLGFVFGMVFAHAPLIFPAISGVAIPYHPRLYGAAILLHLSLVLRVVADLTGQYGLRRWGGLLNETAILLFLALLIQSAWSARRKGVLDGSIGSQ